jgi:predicted MFS family arabinose efflux permease
MKTTSTLYTRDYILLNGSNFLYSLFATIFIFMPPFLDSIGLSPSHIGFLMATGTFVSVAFKPLGGWLADRTNKVIFIIVGSIIASLFTFPWYFVKAPSSILYVYRVFQGIGYSFFATFAYAHIASHAPPERRAEALGVFGLSFFIPTAIGGWIGEMVIARFSFSAFFLIGACIALSSALPAMFMKDRMKTAGIGPSRVLEVLSRDVLVYVLMALIFGTTFGGIFTFLPLFLYKGGRDGIFIFLLCYSISVIATRTVWRKVVDTADKDVSAILSLSLLSSGAALLTFSGDTPILVVASIITGIGHGFLFPSLSTLIVDTAGRENSGISMALFTGAFDLGLVIGSAALGIILEYGGFPITFFSCGVLPLIGVPLLFWKRGKKESSRPAS